MAGAGQGEQEVPHDAGLLSGLHSFPHLWNPGLHLKAQAPFSHVASPFAGVGQGMHERPQLFGLVSSTHRLLHSWRPVGQSPPHGVPLGLQVLVVLQTVVPAGQVGWQTPDLHSAPPPWGARHGVQDVPHEAGLSLFTH